MALQVLRHAEATASQPVLASAFQNQSSAARRRDCPDPPTSSSQEAAGQVPGLERQPQREQQGNSPKHREQHRRTAPRRRNGAPLGGAPVATTAKAGGLVHPAMPVFQQPLRRPAPGGWACRGRGTLSSSGAHHRRRRSILFVHRRRLIGPPPRRHCSSRARAGQTGMAAACRSEGVAVRCPPAPGRRRRSEGREAAGRATGSSWILPRPAPIRVGSALRGMR